MTRHILITGGAGFIGSNLAHALLKAGESVLIFDNLSRPGGKKNLERLRAEHGKRVQVKVADVRSRWALREAVRSAGQVFHLAGREEGTTGLQETVYASEVNVKGTINLLEELRTMKNPPPLLFPSTNKVYGSLSSVSLRKGKTRYEPTDIRIRQEGINEDYPVSFCTPFGRSKGAAEQYVFDYARTYRLPAVVFRLSCIYGLHYIGTEDRSWVADFLTRALDRQAITFSGDGRRVQDVLFIEDLIEAFLLAMTHIQELSGQVFNIGGGPQNSLSLLELVDLIAGIYPEKPQCLIGQWREEDQWYYVSDTARFRSITGWRPKTGFRQGVTDLYRRLHRMRGKSLTTSAAHEMMATCPH